MLLLNLTNPVQMLSRLSNFSMMMCIRSVEGGRRFSFNLSKVPMFKPSSYFNATSAVSSDHAPIRFGGRRMRRISCISVAAAMLHILFLCITFTPQRKVDDAYHRLSRSAFAAAAAISEQDGDDDVTVAPRGHDQTHERTDFAQTSILVTRKTKEDSEMLSKALRKGSLRATQVGEKKRIIFPTSENKSRFRKINNFLKLLGIGSKNAETRKYVAFFVDGKILYPGKDRPPKGAKHHEFLSEILRKSVKHPSENALPVTETEATHQQTLKECKNTGVTDSPTTLLVQSGNEKAKQPTHTSSYDYGKELDRLAAELLDFDQVNASRPRTEVVENKAGAAENVLDHTSGTNRSPAPHLSDKEKDAVVEALINAAIEDALNNPYTVPAVDTDGSRKSAQLLPTKQRTETEAEGTTVTSSTALTSQKTTEEQRETSAVDTFLQSGKFQKHVSTAELLGSDDFQDWLNANSPTT